jgi:hypothetical protein
MPPVEIDGEAVALHAGQREPHFAAASQRIIGESLELRDSSGQLRMRLESRYLR